MWLSCVTRLIRKNNEEVPEESTIAELDEEEYKKERDTSQVDRSHSLP